MALKNSKNNYLRINKEDINSDFVDVSIFETQEKRTSGLSEFDKTEDKRFFVKVDLTFVPEADITLPIASLIRTQSYKALKSLPEFSEWIDC